MAGLIFYVNGRFMPEGQASISVFDLGLLRGYGVFDYTITYNGEPFRWKDHYERLRNSANTVGIDLPWSNSELGDLVRETLEKNPAGEKDIRIIVTGGASPDTFTPADTPTLIIIVRPMRIFPKEFFTEGIKVITFPGKREIPQAKTVNYLHAVQALKRARQEGATEALYTYDGVVSECMACNFFAVKDNRIITAGKDVLDGITRKTILEVVRGKIPVDYRFVKTEEVASLDEAFLTSSAHEVMPIVTIDQTKIGNGKPGPTTRQVMELFDEYVGKGRSLWRRTTAS
ncbi:MAG: aminotransferase class IV [archaeon]